MKKGFTLIEMSIVLMIIAAIIAGVMLGKSLITTSRLQTVITNVNTYTSAVSNFKQAYQGLPGDFTNATTLWGTDSNGCTNGGGSTCNGDGDGKIFTSQGTGKVSETALFWQHLALAGMFSQSTSDKASSGGAFDSTIGANVANGSFRGSGFSVYWWGTVAAGDSVRFSGYYGNIIMFGTSHSIVSGTVDYNITRDPIITADQAAAIDSKMDDGVPATGMVRAYVSSTTIAPNCTTTAVASTSKYNVSANGNLCSLIFVMGF